MTENKRFYMDKSGDLYDKDNGLLMLDFGYSYDGVNCKKIIDLLNELNDEVKELNYENMELDILITNNHLAYIDLERKNKHLTDEIEYIQNSITEHIKHQKTELGQKALKSVIEDWNEWLLGHK